MKKNAHQLISELSSSAQMSSTAVTLQQFKKETEKNVARPESAKMRCQICFKEIAPKRHCSGHSGGGGGEDSSPSDKTSEEKENPSEATCLTKPQKVVETADKILGAFGSESGFDPEIIAELLAKQLVLVKSDRESMTLTIQLLCEYTVLSEEQRAALKQFMEAIIKEFKAENHLSSDCITIIQDENKNGLSLRITMPTLALYDAFIQQLANNLMPAPSPRAQKDDVTKDKSLTINPLSMESKPSNKDKSTKPEEIELNKNIKPEEEKQALFNPSPFNMNPW